MSAACGGRDARSCAPIARAQRGGAGRQPRVRRGAQRARGVRPRPARSVGARRRRACPRRAPVRAVAARGRVARGRARAAPRRPRGARCGTRRSSGRTCRARWAGCCACRWCRCRRSPIPPFSLLHPDDAARAMVAAIDAQRSTGRSTSSGRARRARGRRCGSVGGSRSRCSGRGGTLPGTSPRSPARRCRRTSSSCCAKAAPATAPARRRPVAPGAAVHARDLHRAVRVGHGEPAPPGRGCGVTTAALPTVGTGAGACDGDRGMK